MRRRDIFTNELAGIATINQRSRQIAHTFRPQEFKSVERNVNRSLPLPHRIVEAAVQKLLLVDGRIAIDRHAAGKPILAELLKALHDLVAAGLTRGEINGRAINGNGEARALAAFPREDGARSIGGGELRLGTGHARRK